MNGNRIEELDLLRTCAIIGVLIIHSASRYVSTEMEQLVGGWFSTFTRPCIPIFLFISGFLLGNSEFTKALLIRRLKRVLVPYTVFSVLAFFYTYQTSLFSKPPRFYLYILLRFVIGDSMNIYYFVFIIVITYLLFYYVRKLRIPIYTILTVFAMLTLIHVSYYFTAISAFGADHTLFTYLYTYRYVFWPFFFFLGVVTCQSRLLELCKLNSTQIICLWGIVFVLYNIIYFMKMGNYDGFNSVIGTVYSVCTIFMLLCLRIKSTIVGYLSSLSYYLYLSHIFIVYLLYDCLKHFGINVPFSFSIVSLMLSLGVPLFLYELQKRLFSARFSKIIGA